MYYDYRQDDLYLSQRDEDALFEFINGQNDALNLKSPQSDSYYYLQGWYDTKRKLARGKQAREFERVQAEIEPQENWTADEWEEF
jgi:hypothetical protein